MAKNQSKHRFNYFIALNNFAIFLIAERAYGAAQKALETALDVFPIMKKMDVQSPELDIAFRFNLVSLFTKSGDLGEARIHLNEAERLFNGLNRQGKRMFHDTMIVSRSLLNCAAGQYDGVEEGIARANNPSDVNLVSALAKVRLARGEFAPAEQAIRAATAPDRNIGTPHRPENVESSIDLAEALFGQGKHDDAFASFEEARSIVADFALPADAAWRKALEIWLKRAKDLGRTELAASLESEIAQASATPVQAITILEKFRIHPKANG